MVESSKVAPDAENPKIITEELDITESRHKGRRKSVVDEFEVRGVGGGDDGWGLGGLVRTPHGLN